MSSDWCFGRRLLFRRVSSLRSVVVELDFLAQYSYLLYNDLSLYGTNTILNKKVWFFFLSHFESSFFTLSREREHFTPKETYRRRRRHGRSLFSIDRFLFLRRLEEEEDEDEDEDEEDFARRRRRSRQKTRPNFLSLLRRRRIPIHVIRK